MIAEMYASRTGIGHLIANWGENFQMQQLFAGVILLAVVAIAFNESGAMAGGAMQHTGGHDRAARQPSRDRGRPCQPRLAGAQGGVPRCEDISHRASPPAASS